MNTTRHEVTTPEPIAVNAVLAGKLCGVSRAKWFALHSAARVPRPITSLGRCPRWLVSELRDWLAAGAPPRDRWEKIKAGSQPRGAAR